ncbi:hypothetical protein VKT23_007467 [Stygiomarasmius scandens]|uniref:Uncharacterized protein n=1 Tax=Marasmiellus scandens TaxID=2682957 RepID=A0ABR1JMH3_9AGAR
MAEQAHFGFLACAEICGVYLQYTIMTDLSIDPLTCRNLIYACSVFLMLLQAVLLYLSPPTQALRIDPYAVCLLVLAMFCPLGSMQFTFTVLSLCKDVISLYPKLLPLLFWQFYVSVSIMMAQFELSHLRLPFFLVVFSMIPSLVACKKAFTSLLSQHGFNRQELDYLDHFIPGS